MSDSPKMTQAQSLYLAAIKRSGGSVSRRIVASDGILSLTWTGRMGHVHVEHIRPDGHIVRSVVPAGDGWDASGVRD